jgi:hypothetical protein
MRTKRRPIPEPIPEFAGMGEVFNLFSETGEDGARLRREAEQAEADRQEAQAIMQRRQLLLLNAGLLPA